MVSTVGSTKSHNKHLSFSGLRFSAQTRETDVDIKRGTKLPTVPIPVWSSFLCSNRNTSPPRFYRLFPLVSSPRPVRRPGLQHGRKGIRFILPHISAREPRSVTSQQKARLVRPPATRRVSKTAAGVSERSEDLRLRRKWEWHPGPGVPDQLTPRSNCCELGEEMEGTFNTKENQVSKGENGPFSELQLHASLPLKPTFLLLRSLGPPSVQGSSFSQYSSLFTRSLVSV